MQISFVNVKSDGSTEEIMSIPLSGTFPANGDRIGIKVTDGIILFQVAGPPQWNFGPSPDGGGVTVVVVIMVIQVGQMTAEEVKSANLVSQGVQPG